MNYKEMSIGISFLFEFQLLHLKKSKTSPGALCEWEAWEVISPTKILLFS